MARILIIDDDDILTATVAGRLGTDGHDVQAVHEGDRALAAIQRAQPDLVILDHHLPGIRGIGVLARIRADPGLEDVPVIMLTAETEDVVLTRAHEVGADDYLRKPVDLDELAARVAAMLRGAAIVRSTGAA